jgi:hypothetical protein
MDHDCLPHSFSFIIRNHYYSNPHNQCSWNWVVKYRKKQQTTPQARLKSEGTMPWPVHSRCSISARPQKNSYLIKYGKYKQGTSSCCKSCFSNLQCWNLPQTRRYGATLSILSEVKCYGDGSTWTCQFASRSFPGFVHFLFFVVPVRPSLPLPPPPPQLWKHIPLSLWCQRGNIAVTSYYWWCKECSAVTARPRWTIPTPDIGNTWFATFPRLYFSVFCKVTEFYGLGLMGHTVYMTGSCGERSVQQKRPTFTLLSNSACIIRP